MKKIACFVFFLTVLLPGLAKADPPPASIVALCHSNGEQVLSSAKGEEIFHGAASGVFSCNGGSIWKVIENGARVPDSATFYLGADGQVVDVCQLLFSPDACRKYEDSCGQTNYCSSSD